MIRLDRKERFAMQNLPASSTPDRFSYLDNRAKWSPSEKSVARKIFDGALQRELDEVMQEVKRRAEGIKSPSDVWKLEDYLTQMRKEIDRKYDYRYSELVIVFGQLLHQGRISEKDLAGLAEDKVVLIRRLASFAQQQKDQR
jgi:hypothetical protein